MPRTRRSNPLALAALVCLVERPMHPYEMASTMRTRGKHESIKLNYGSLYTVVAALERGGLIEHHETERAGRRPERTVYRLTDAGRIELVDWLSELFSTPTKEFTQLEAALSLMGALPPDDVAGLLGERVQRLDLELTAQRSVLEYAHAQGLPRLFTVESEYRIMLHEAERAWVAELAGQIRDGSLEGLEQWRTFHRDDEEPGAPRLREAGT